MSDDRDISAHIGQYVANAVFSHLPAEAVEAAKKSILDTYGVCLAARAIDPGVQPYLDFAKSGGADGECTIFGGGPRVPAAMAAFANGALAHALDFDDRTEWGQHGASSLIPAVVAVAEKIGGVDGRRLITAVAVGQDLFNRFRQFIDWRKDWNFSSVMGVYSATAAISNLMGFSARQVVDALSIASLHSSGTAEIVNAPGGGMRGAYPAFPAMGAVNSAILVSCGGRGIESLFEGRRGVMELYFAGRYDKPSLLDGLGIEFHGHRTLYKVWPAVGVAHSHIHATIKIVIEHDIRPTDIAEIQVSVGDYHALLCEPLEARRKPANHMDARFSLPYLVAAAAVRRGIRLSDFSDESLGDEVVHMVAEKVSPVPDSSLDWKLESPPGKVAIKTVDGKTFCEVGNGVPGNADAQLTWDQVARKFLDCASLAEELVPKEASLNTVDFVSSIEVRSDAAAFLSNAS